MTVYEMHIAIDQGFNQVASARNRKIQPEEKDYYLNKIQERIIRSCLKPKDNGAFEVDQLQVDKIHPLIVSYKDLVPYILTGQNRYKCYLPFDYSYLLSDWALTEINSKQYKTAKTLHITALRQGQSAKGSAPYYVTNVVSLKGTTVNIPTNLPYGNTHIGYPKKEDIAFLAPQIALMGNWYWEKFGAYNYPGHYIWANEAAGSGTPSTIIDGTSTAVTTSVTENVSVHAPIGTPVKVTNRLLPSNKVQEINIPFYKTAHYSPISELAGNILYIYNDNSFIVTGVGISYVRKPQIISLSLGTTSELAEGYHQGLCDLVIEHLKGRVENVPGTQLSERDIDKRVTL